MESIHNPEPGSRAARGQLPRLLPPPRTATEFRNTPGRAYGISLLPEVKGDWLKMNQYNPIPRSIARKLSGRSFRSFNEFRAAFWWEVSQDPVLSEQFKPGNRTLMQRGLAPKTPTSGQYGRHDFWILHHEFELREGGGTYEMENIFVVTPRFHQDIHHGSSN